MYQGTTPTVRLRISGYDLTDKTVYVSFQHKRKLITKTGSSLIVTYDAEADESLILVPLSQKNTQEMEDTVQVQVRFIDVNGQAYATKKAEIDVDSVLYRKKIDYMEVDDNAEQQA